MKSLLAEIQDWDAAFIQEPRPAETNHLPIEHLKRQIAAQSDLALLLLQACGLEMPNGHVVRTSSAGF